MAGIVSSKGEQTESLGRVNEKSGCGNDSMTISVLSWHPLLAIAINSMVDDCMKLEVFSNVKRSSSSFETRVPSTFQAYEAAPADSFSMKGWKGAHPALTSMEKEA